METFDFKNRFKGQGGDKEGAKTGLRQKGEIKLASAGERSGSHTRTGSRGRKSALVASFEGDERPVLVGNSQIQRLLAKTFVYRIMMVTLPTITPHRQARQGSGGASPGR